MKYLKTFESHNTKIDQVLSAIKSGRFVLASVIKNLPDHDPKDPISPLSVDEDGLVTVDIDGQDYEVDIENIQVV